MVFEQLGGAFEHFGALLDRRRAQAGKPASAAAIAVRTIASSASRTLPTVRPSIGEVTARSMPTSYAVDQRRRFSGSRSVADLGHKRVKACALAEFDAERFCRSGR